jgi:hypothetical protein
VKDSYNGYGGYGANGNGGGKRPRHRLTRTTAIPIYDGTRPPTRTTRSPTRKTASLTGYGLRGSTHRRGTISLADMLTYALQDDFLTPARNTTKS